jgi:hypothetical protein
MAKYEKKTKEKDPTIKGVAAPSNGSFSEHDYTNIERNDAKRCRSWTFVVYPGESLPENWKDILGNLMIPWAISPLHDEDVNEDGEIKKAHRHLLLCFNTVKSYGQIKEIAKILGAPSPQSCLSSRAMVRYFLHMDDPKKAQYKRENIEYGGGFDLENALKPTPTDEQEILFLICDFLEDNGIHEFASANSWIRHNKREWWGVFLKKSAFIYNIIKSQRCNPMQYLEASHDR